MPIIELHLKIRSPFKEIFETEYKYKVITAGRRVGKTYASAQWLITQMIKNKEKKGLWVDVRQSNLDKYVERYFRPLLGSMWKYCDYHIQKKILTFWNKSYIDFASAENPTSNEGFQYDCMVLNEAGNILKNPSLWTNTLNPMAKGENTKVVFIGTPRGRNYFWNLYNMQNNSPEYKSWKITALDSDLWTKSELDRVQLALPEMAWRQEYLGEFLEENAGVFRKVSGCIDQNLALLDEGLPDHKYILGVDLAKYHDFTVLIGIDMATKQIVYFDRFNKLDWGFQQQKILEAHKNFNNAYIVIDATGVGDPIYENLSKTIHSRIIPFKINNASKKELIEELSIAIESKKLSYPQIEEMISELQSYEFDISKFGNVRYSAPEGLYDDCVIALCLAWYGARSKSGTAISVQYEKTHSFNYGVESGSTTFEEIDKMIKGSLGKR